MASMLESKFQSELNNELRQMFPGCVILKNDSGYIQGFPDWLILFENMWAAYECKRSAKAKQQPNQDYYVDLLDGMSLAAFVYPENKEQFLDAIHAAFRAGRSSRIPQRQ